MSKASNNNSNKVSIVDLSKLSPATEFKAVGGSSLTPELGNKIMSILEDGQIHRTGGIAKEVFGEASSKSRGAVRRFLRSINRQSQDAKEFPAPYVGWVAKGQVKLVSVSNKNQIDQIESQGWKYQTQD